MPAGRPRIPYSVFPAVSPKPLTREDAAQFRTVAEEAVEFALFTLDLFEKVVLGNSGYVDLILSDDFTHRTYYMGMVDEQNRVNFL